MCGDLSHRVATQGTDDDFDQLAINLNEMLSRIQRLMDDVRRVSDNIAHDLRTPLTRLRTRLEQLQDRALTRAEVRHGATAAIDETTRLLETFNALLRIARIEARATRGEHTRVDLTRVAQDALDYYEALAEEKTQTLTGNLDSSCTVIGDRHLLFQCFANLLDNAIKYTPPGGLVRVASLSREGGCVIEISDSGPRGPRKISRRGAAAFLSFGKRSHHPRERSGVGAGQRGCAVARC